MPERSGKDIINLMNVQFTSCAQGLINILSPTNFFRLDKMMQITTFNWFEEIIASYLQFSKVQVIHCKISILLSTISITSNILLAILKIVLFSIFPCGTPDFLLEQHFFIFHYCQSLLALCQILNFLNDLQVVFEFLVLQSAIYNSKQSNVFDESAFISSNILPYPRPDLLYS